MTEDREWRLPDDQLAALGQALRDGAIRTPPNAPPAADILTGSEAAVLRRTIAIIIDDELSRRQVLSERQIREIARDVAHAVYVEAVRGVEERIRGFFTEEGIEEIVLRILRDAGILADPQHAYETRQTVEGLFRSYKRRSALGDDFVKEVLKAVIGLGVAAILGGFGTYMTLVAKGVIH